MGYIIQNIRTGLYVTRIEGLENIHGTYLPSDATVYNTYEEADYYRAKAQDQNPRGKYIVIPGK